MIFTNADTNENFCDSNNWPNAQDQKLRTVILGKLITAAKKLMQNVKIYFQTSFSQTKTVLVFCIVHMPHTVIKYYHGINMNASMEVIDEQ